MYAHAFQILPVCARCWWCEDVTLPSCVHLHAVIDLGRALFIWQLTVVACVCVCVCVRMGNLRYLMYVHTHVQMEGSTNDNNHGNDDENDNHNGNMT